MSTFFVEDVNQGRRISVALSREGRAGVVFSQEEVLFALNPEQVGLLISLINELMGSFSVYDPYHFLRIDVEIKPETGEAVFSFSLGKGIRPKIIFTLTAEDRQRVVDGILMAWEGERPVTFPLFPSFVKEPEKAGQY